MKFIFHSNYAVKKQVQKMGRGTRNIKDYLGVKLRMFLSDYNQKFYQVIRDGEFATLGQLCSEVPYKYLAFAESESFLEIACGKENVSCILCTEELSALNCLKNTKKGIAVSKLPRAAFFKLHNWLTENQEKYMPDLEDTTIGRNCKIDSTAHIAEKGVKIGSNVTVEEFAVIRSGTVIGDNVVIRSGAIIGGSNQVLFQDEKGELYKVVQSGRTELASYIEVGYHALIARGVFPYEITKIGDRTYIDYGVAIDHNCRIGKNVKVLAQSQVCGNTDVGDGVTISPGAVISNRLKIGDDSSVTIGSVVVNNVKKGVKVAGNFAIEHNKFLLWHRRKLQNKLKI